MKPASGTFLSAVAWNAALVVLAWPIGIGMAIAVGRYLGPSGKGEYALATLLGTLFFTLLNLGIPASISYHLAGRHMPGDALVKTAVLLAGLLAAVAFVIALVLDRTGWCAHIFGVPRLTSPMWLVLASIPFQFTGTFLLFVILAQGHRVLFGAIPALGQILGGILIAALVLSGRLTTLSAVGAVVASQMLPASVLLIYLQHELRWLHAPLLDSKAWARLASYSALTHLANSFQFLTQRIDVLMVSAFLDMRAVGLYSVAYGSAEVLLLLPQRFGILYLPRIAGDQQPAGKADEIRSSSSLVFVGTVAAAALLALAAPLAIRLAYGRAFVPSITPLLLLLPGICALATCNIQAAYLSGTGRVRINTAVSGFGLLFNVALNLFAIPRYGIIGAAATSSLTYAAQALLLSRAVARVTNATPLSLFTSVSPSLAAGFLRRLLRLAPASSHTVEVHS